MNKNKKLGFTLAEVLIVIGIIGVVAALTLPNLNHATGDKETITRYWKAYSILSEANDRAVAIYGPISTWSGECKNDLNDCWMKRISEFLKVTKHCTSQDNCNDAYISGGWGADTYQLPDGITFSAWYPNNVLISDCSGVAGFTDNKTYKDDICIRYLDVDLDGVNKGKNREGYDVFEFAVSDSIGIMPGSSGDHDDSFVDELKECISGHGSSYCSNWVYNFNNLDYLKADSTGKCNDSNIVLDGVTNTSCH